MMCAGLERPQRSEVGARVLSIVFENTKGYLATRASSPVDQLLLFPNVYFEPRPRIELGTSSLRVTCSTN